MKFAYRSHSQWDGISFNESYKKGNKDLQSYEWQNFIEPKEDMLAYLNQDINIYNLLHTNKSIFFFYNLIKALK